MLKTYNLLSSGSSYPLAQIRTDGNNISIVSDNTPDGLASKVKTFKDLVRLVNKSSVLSLEEGTDTIIHILRYVMDNGDVVEMTEDGKTAILNGTLLNESEQNALFEAIKRKEINVAHKTDSSSPIQMLPPMKVMPKAESSQSTEISKGMLESIKRSQSQLQSIRSMSTKSYDYEIENGNYDDSEDPAYVKKMLYKLKYGG